MITTTGTRFSTSSHKQKILIRKTTYNNYILLLNRYVSIALGAMAKPELMLLVTADTGDTECLD